MCKNTSYAILTMYFLICHIRLVLLFTAVSYYVNGSNVLWIFNSFLLALCPCSRLVLLGAFHVLKKKRICMYIVDIVRMVVFFYPLFLYIVRLGISMSSLRKCLPSFPFVNSFIAFRRFISIRLIFYNWIKTQAILEPLYLCPFFLVCFISSLFKFCNVCRWHSVFRYQVADNFFWDSLYICSKLNALLWMYMCEFRICFVQKIDIKRHKHFDQAEAAAKKYHNGW